MINRELQAQASRARSNGAANKKAKALLSGAVRDYLSGRPAKAVMDDLVVEARK